MDTKLGYNELQVLIDIVEVELRNVEPMIVLQPRTMVKDSGSKTYNGHYGDLLSIKRKLEDMQSGEGG